MFWFCCRAGNACPFFHDSSKLQVFQHGAQPVEPSSSTIDPSRTTPIPAQDHSAAIGVSRAPEEQNNGRRYEPPPVAASRVVQKPVSRLQKDNPKEFQIQQLERRFPTLKRLDDGGTTLRFQIAPSDPDFPFEMTALDCVLHVPEAYPGGATPSLTVKNHDMPRGYQINVENGFDQLVHESPKATLLFLLNALDKQLETILTREKAETIKITPNATRHLVGQQSDINRPSQAVNQSQATGTSVKQEVQYTASERRTAEARRQVEVRQLEARLGRSPLFSVSSDGTAFTVPFFPGRPGDLPVPLQAVQTVKLIVPLLYPLQACKVEIPGVSKEVTGKIEKAFIAKAVESTQMTLMAHINSFAQNMHVMAAGATVERVSKPHIEAAVKAELPETVNFAGGSAENEDDRSHIKIIPRPPEWITAGEEDSDSDDDFSDSYDSGDDIEDDHQDAHGLESVPEASSSQNAERGIALSFPSLELHHIELLDLASLSISIKCTRCKTGADISNLGSSTARSSSCSKCAQPFSLTYRPELMHANSFRAGYLDLTGCTVTDMLPSAFIPTCSTCSTAVPAPGVVSVRGDASSIAICRECHQRLSFKIPESKFMLVSNTSLHPRNLLPLRRKQPKESLGIVAGQELPRRGRCTHYAKSYRWFRFSCCGKVYACDKCHDDAEGHPNEHANRMICGFCSREQNYRPEDCGLCRAVVVGKRGSGFWEGGKGTRDKARMSRKDPRKYKRRPGTRVGGAKKGGESAKKKE
ncbi:MAG: hypothetical protein Q9220_000601 [cf. Caloplaca sp. 1 TL-2023]